jgi:hypothetical protein
MTLLPASLVAATLAAAVPFSLVLELVQKAELPRIPLKYRGKRLVRKLSLL